MNDLQYTLRVEFGSQKDAKGTFNALDSAQIFQSFQN